MNKVIVIGGLLFSVATAYAGFSTGVTGAGQPAVQNSSSTLPGPVGGTNPGGFQNQLTSLLNGLVFAPGPGLTQPLPSGADVVGSNPAPTGFSYGGSVPGVCSVSNGQVTVSGLGTCEVSMTFSGDPNYQDATITGSFEVTEINPGLVAPSGPASGLSGIGDTYQFPASLTSGGETFSAEYGGSTAGVCSVTPGGLVESLGVGSCPVTVSVAQQGLFSAVNLGPVSVAVVADGGILLSGSDPISSDNIGLLGLPAATENDLQTNQNCGGVDCLTAFNTQKASTSCTALSPGATDAQVETFVNCVMNEVNDAVATAAIAALDTTPSLPASGGSPAACQANLNLPVPSFCGHSQWDCSVTSSNPAGLSMSGPNLSMTANYNGVASTVTYNVRVEANRYNSSLVYNVPYTVNVPGTPPAITSYTLSNGKMPLKVYRACVNAGGRVATLAEIEDHLGQTLSSYASHQDLYTYATGVIPNTTNWTNCPANQTIMSTRVVVYEKYHSQWNLRDEIKHGASHKSTHEHLKYRDANNSVQNTGCKFSSGGWNATTNYFCAQPSACPSN